MLRIRHTLILLACSGFAWAQPGAPKEPAPAQPGQEAAQPASKLPTPDELFERHIEAIGGRETLKAKKNCITEGTIVSGDRSFFALYSSCNVARNKLRVKIEVPGGLTESRFFNGEFGWIIRSSNEGVILVAEDLLDIAQAADMHIFLHHDEVYSNAVTTKEQEIRGTVCYTVEADNKYGQRERLHFAKDSGLLSVIETKANTPDKGPQPLTILQQEYKSFDGMLVPTLITQIDGMGNQFIVKLSKVRYDVPDAEIPDFSTPQWLVDALEPKAPATPAEPPKSGG